MRSGRSIFVHSLLFIRGVREHEKFVVELDLCLKVAIVFSFVSVLVQCLMRKLVGLQFKVWRQLFLFFGNDNDFLFP